jgi:hypothetical protein
MPPLWMQLSAAETEVCLWHFSGCLLMFWNSCRFFVCCITMSHLTISGEDVVQFCQIFCWYILWIRTFHFVMYLFKSHIHIYSFVSDTVVHSYHLKLNSWKSRMEIKYHSTIFQALGLHVVGSGLRRKQTSTNNSNSWWLEIILE